MSMLVETIAAKELDEYLEQEGTLLIDLRSREAFRKCHIKGAVNLPAEDGKRISFSKGSLLIFYCERGARSLVTARRYAMQGYRVKSVAGGIRAYRGKNLVGKKEKEE